VPARLELHTCFFEPALEILAVHYGREMNGCTKGLKQRLDHRRQLPFKSI
jgi:hypothetical protein